MSRAPRMAFLSPAFASCGRRNLDNAQTSFAIQSQDIQRQHAGTASRHLVKVMIRTYRQW